METKLEDLDLKFYIIFFNKDFKIFHAVGYEEYPNIADVMNIITELHSDKEFGIGDEIYTQKLDIITAEEFDNMSEEDMDNT